MEETLRRIPTKDIEKNPLNPRLQFDPTQMESLKKSIEKVGILVPLTVYKKGDGKYCLVDGKRRYRCALDLNKKEVPAIIIPEPDPQSNLLQMFTIHHLRLQWKLIWTAMKLETLMLMMKTENDDELAAYTGMSKRKIDRCKRILYFPKKYQQILLVPEKDETISPDFFVELYPVLKSIRKELPKLLEKFSEEQFIDALIAKFRCGNIKAAREFRYLKQVLDGGREGSIAEEKVIELFSELVNNSDMDIRQISRLLRLSPGTREMSRSCQAIANALAEIKPEEVEKDEELKQAIFELSKQVERLGNNSRI
jgi:ParB/RepB/Spo0J family partition protein